MAILVPGEGEDQEAVAHGVIFERKFDIVCAMSQSLRFGPHPPDLQPPREAAPKDGYARFERRDFEIVRARVEGEWRLGVLREWHRAKHGWMVRIEFPDQRSIGRSSDVWFQFEPSSVDPLAVDPETGIVLLPPRLRGVISRAAAKPGPAPSGGLDVSAPARAEGDAEVRVVERDAGVGETVRLF